MDKLLTVRQVASLYSVHPKTVYAWAKAGRIPKPVKEFKGRWLESSIRDHLDRLRRRQLLEVA